MSRDFVRLLAYVITSHHTNLSKMSKHWGSFLSHCIKANGLRPQVPHSFMSNIIPLPFESSLSASYADASELVQAMQRLERHLAHVVNSWVTSKWFCCLRLALY